MSDAGPLRWQIDLHVHTRRFSPCAESLDPWLLPQIMSRRGMHGVVITEHDHLWPPLEIAELNRSCVGKRIFAGVEISSRHGHFLVIGLDHLDNLPPGVSARRIVREAKSQGAVVIWAHPLLTYSQTRKPLKLFNTPAGIDAIEVASTVTFGAQSDELRDHAGQIGVAMVGGSDAHSLDQVGQVFTLFAHMPADEKELAAAIRSGRCKATFLSESEHGASHHVAVGGS